MKPSQSRQVTIFDVAEKAKVSIATVSRVFNNNPLVPEKTRKRILAIAEQMKYLPNSSARTLAGNQNKTIGVILPVIYGIFFSDFLYGAETRARESGYHLLVTSVQNNDSELLTLLGKMNGVADGFLIYYPQPGIEKLLNHIPQGKPAAIIGKELKDSRFFSFLIDNFNGAYQAASYMLNQGHRKITLVTGEKKNLDAEQRKLGFKKAISDLGGEEVKLQVLEGNFKQNSGYELAPEIMREKNRSTAVFFSNDGMALGFYEWMSENGMKIPEDISVIGFDDIEWAALLQPGLTTMKFDIVRMGRDSVSEILKRIADAPDQTPVSPVVYQTRLVQRGSFIPLRN